MRIQLLQWGIFPVTCAGYIGYPFKNRAGSSTASSSLAIYLLERENGKGPEAVVFDVLFRTDI